MRQSEKINTLLESLVKVQAELPTLPKDKNGYGYKYTDLDTVISTIKPLLAKNNLGFMQMLSTLENNKSAITTRIFNSSGEWIEDTTPLPDVSMAKTNAAQNLGAAITYMKRYSLCSMLGISSDEDVDGNIENFKKVEQPKQPEKQPEFKGGADTPEQKKKIVELLNTTDKAGKKIITPQEAANVGKWRQEHTADEVIEKLKGLINERYFPEDIPFEPSEKEKEDLNVIF